MLTLLDRFSASERGKVWLYAYERHYRERIFQAIHANHDHGTWTKRHTRPDSQIIFCIDDREESFRRHLEELNPAIETFGAAGFFGVPMNYKGLDDARVTPLCPMVVTPAHEVQGNTQARQRRKPASGIMVGANWFSGPPIVVHQSLRRNLLLSHPVIDAIAPITFAGLLAKSILPKRQQKLASNIRQIVSPPVDTQLMFTSTDNATVATPASAQAGLYR